MAPLTLSFAEPEPERAPAPDLDSDPSPAAAPRSPPRRAPPRATASSLLRAWLFDTALACALTAACAFATLRIGRVRYPFDFLRDTSHLWFALAVCFAVSWSFFASALRRRRNR